MKTVLLGNFIATHCNSIKKTQFLNLLFSGEAQEHYQSQGFPEGHLISYKQSLDFDIPHV
jgi:hypothetical protein